MKAICLLPMVFFVVACESSEPISAFGESPVECEIQFNKLGVCAYKNKTDIKVKVESEMVADDEKTLKALEVEINKKKILLPITPDTAILEGDIGYISFSDINFDGFPDLSITTSFGVANLYLDYWVYVPYSSTYIHVGNFPHLTLNAKEKTVSATVKINAASYESKTWRWHGVALEPVKH